MRRTVLQILPALEAGGVERGTLEVAAELARRDYRSIVVSGGGRLVPELLAGGSEHITLPVGKKSLTSLGLIPKLTGLFRREEPAIIHARSRLPAWLAWLARRGLNGDRRPAFVTTVHGPYSVNAYSRIMTRGERVIAISGYIRDYILKNYPAVDAENITLIHRGVSRRKYPHDFKPAPAWREQWEHAHPELRGRFILTLPARITRWKGHEDFIRIIGQTIQAGLNAHGLIAGAAARGKRAYLGELQAKIRRVGLDRHITFLGHCDDMREVMSISDIVLSLARTPEAFGRTALEALALGVPVIAYDHGGAAEVLGAVFPEGRARPLDIDHAVALIQSFHNTRPRVKAQNPFTLKAMLDKTLAIYDSLC